MTDIYVNADQWNAIDDSEKEKIVEGLRSTGSITGSDEIKADPNTPPFDPSEKIEIMWDPVRDLCLIACDTAAGAALAWCAANTAGIGLVACQAAAVAVRNKCRDGC